MEQKINTLNTFTTHTASYSGMTEIGYTFTSEGVWEVESVQYSSQKKSWNLEGMWSLEIFTYYIDVAIINMDFSNNVADIQCRGNVLQGAGKVKTIQVDFEERDGCIYFDTFVVGDGGTFSPEKEITLVAKEDDMNYTESTLTAGGKPIYSKVGGEKYLLKKKQINHPATIA